MERTHGDPTVVANNDASDQDNSLVFHVDTGKRVLKCYIRNEYPYSIDLLVNREIPRPSEVLLCSEETPKLRYITCINRRRIRS